MDKKKLIMLIAGGALALVVLTILIVGVFEGIWPWDGPKAYAKIFRTEPTAPAATEPVTPQPEGEEVEDPTTETVPGSQGTNLPTPTTGNPVIDGETPTGGKVDEEVVVGGNTGNENSGNEDSGSEDSGNDSGSTGGNTAEAPDADSVHAGNKVPGWGN